MSANHDQLLQWAAANPTDPRSQAVRMKVWAEQHPDDPRSGAVMAKLKVGAQSSAPKEESSALLGAADAGARGAASTATMGYLPQIQAAVDVGGHKLRQFLGVGPEAEDAELKAQGVNLQEPSLKDQYIQSRDSFDQQNQAVASAHPVASLAGKVAGGLAASAYLPGGSAKGLGMLGGGLKLAGQGALTGGLYNPGETTGQISPLQPKQRLINAGIGAGVNTALGGASALLEKGADKQAIINSVNNPADLAPEVKGAIDSAEESINQTQIKPRADQLRELLKGKTAPVSPDELRGVSPRLDRYADALEKRMTSDAATASPLENFKTMATDSAPTSIDRPANIVNSLKREADQTAGYAAGKPFDPTAVAKEAQAKSLADSLRSRVSSLDPGVEPLNNQMREIYQRTSPVFNAAKTGPIAALNPSNLDKQSAIENVDKLAGSDLSGLYDKINSANKLKLDPVRLIKPLEMPDELRRIGLRGAYKASDLVNKSIPDGARQGAEMSLLDFIRGINSQQKE